MSQKIENAKQELYEIEEFDLATLGHKAKITAQIVEKIINTFAQLKPGQAFVVPKSVVSHNLIITKILVDEFQSQKLRTQPIGSNLYGRHYTGTRLIKMK